MHCVSQPARFESKAREQPPVHHHCSTGEYLCLCLPANNVVPEREAQPSVSAAAAPRVLNRSREVDHCMPHAVAPPTEPPLWPAHHFAATFGRVFPLFLLAAPLRPVQQNRQRAWVHLQMQQQWHQDFVPYLTPGAVALAHGRQPRLCR
eukprot:SAG31_NODE_298_length_18125_cov_27.373350_3_plen_149_part_00